MSMTLIDDSFIEQFITKLDSYLDNRINQVKSIDYTEFSTNELNESKLNEIKQKGEEMKNKLQEDIVIKFRKVLNKINIYEKEVGRSSRCIDKAIEVSQTNFISNLYETNNKLDLNEEINKIQT